VTLRLHAGRVAAILDSFDPQHARTETHRPLPIPLNQIRSHQDRERHRYWLSPIQNHFHEIRREQRQPENATDIGRIDFLRRSDFPDARRTSLARPPACEAQSWIE
jgi:hypothetical protein